MCNPYKIDQTFTYHALGGVENLGYPTCTVVCTAPNQGRTVSYQYTDGRVTRVDDSNGSIGSWISSVSFNSNGTWATAVHGNGVTDNQAIDPNSMRRPASLYTTGVQSGQNWSTGPYTYDGSGNISHMGQDDFTYDKVSRVVTSVVSGSTQDYTYDAYGNLLSVTTGGSTRNIPANSSTNRLQGAHLYDGRGNLKYWGAQEFHEYDELNMIKQVHAGSNAGAPVARAYAYTADDERLLTVSGPFEYEFTLRDLDGKVLREIKSDPATETWSVTLDNIWMDGRLVGFVDNGSEVHAHTDHLGTPRLHTDANGAEVSRHIYFPFGEEIPPAGQSLIPMKFTGHERDASTIGTAAELDYMHARYYSAHWGRFSSVDPAQRSFDLKLPQSWNRYSYVRNNPTKFVDPDGEILETAWDLANIGIGIASLIDNLSEGSVGGALLDVGGLVVDTAAAAVPVVPGGAGAAIKAGRTGAKVAKTAGLLEAGTRSARLTQRGLDHIVLRHFASSGVKGTGRFSSGTNLKQLRSMIATALESGSVRANTRGRPGKIVEHTFDHVIGTTGKGATAKTLRVVVKDGQVVTAFPVY